MTIYWKIVANMCNYKFYYNIKECIAQNLSPEEDAGKVIYKRNKTYLNYKFFSSSTLCLTNAKVTGKPNYRVRKQIIELFRTLFFLISQFF